MIYVPGHRTHSSVCLTIGEVCPNSNSQVNEYTYFGGRLGSGLDLLAVGMGSLLTEAWPFLVPEKSSSGFSGLRYTVSLLAP